MNADSLAAQIRTRLGLRVTPQTLHFIEKSLAARLKAPFFVLAADARTGVAVRTQIDPTLLNLQPGSQPAINPSKPNEQLMLF